MNFRLVSSASIGAMITAALLFTMHILIESGPGPALDERPDRRLVYLREIRDTPTDVLDFLPIPDRTVARLPPRPAPDPFPPGDGPAITIPSQAAPPDTGLFDDPLSAPADGGLMTVVRVQPTFPARAASLGLEGYVVVGFDVTATGTVANARVVESTHAMFSQSALHAIERFRYKPRVVNGEPQASYGLRFQFTFELEQ